MNKRKDPFDLTAAPGFFTVARMTGTLFLVFTFFYLKINFSFL